jgi:hypothetical protein
MKIKAVGRSGLSQFDILNNICLEILENTTKTCMGKAVSYQVLNARRSEYDAGAAPNLTSAFCNVRLKSKFTRYWGLSDCNYVFFRSIVRCCAICFSSVSTGSRLSETVAATAGHHRNFCRLVIREMHFAM